MRGGVDIVQIREKELADGELLPHLHEARDVTRRLGVPLVVNDRPDLALLCEADFVHLGQDDLPIAAARKLGVAVGQSTHAPEEIDAAEADYIGVGPVYATPTKEGRPAVGLELVRYAAARARQPWFAIGGIDETNVSRSCGCGRDDGSPSSARSATRTTPSAQLELSGTRWAPTSTEDTVLSDKTTTIRTHGSRLAGTGTRARSLDRRHRARGRSPSSDRRLLGTQVRVTLAACEAVMPRRAGSRAIRWRSSSPTASRSGEIAVRLGVSQATVRHWLLEYGIETERATLLQLRASGRTRSRQCGCDRLLSTPRSDGVPSPCRRRLAMPRVPCPGGRGAPPIGQGYARRRGGRWLRALRILAQHGRAPVPSSRRDRKGVPDLPARRHAVDR